MVKKLDWKKIRLQPRKFSFASGETKRNHKKPKPNKKISNRQIEGKTNKPR